MARLDDALVEMQQLAALKAKTDFARALFDAGRVDQAIATMDEVIADCERLGKGRLLNIAIKVRRMLEAPRVDR